MYRLDLGLRDPVDMARRLARRGGFAWLDSAMRHERYGRRSFLSADPFGLFRVVDGVASWNGSALTGHPLDAFRDRLATVSTLPAADAPLQGAAIGFFSYEFGRLLERLPIPGRRQEAVPQAHFGFHDVVITVDHETGRAVLTSTGLPESDPGRRERRAKERADTFLDWLDGPPATAGPGLIRREAFAFNLDRSAFEAAVARTIRYVLDGDVFQANISRRLAAPIPGDFDPFAFYLRLRARNPAPFAAFIDAGDFAVASSSPERFIRVANDLVEACPIKGTARRSSDPGEDARFAAALLASEKDRAENVMIVDLLRSDLSRVCRPFTVEVPKLAELESFASVHHLVSVVRGRLRDGLDPVDAVRAAFPCGSVTGAPKIRAMEIISELEGVERGAYCGSIGWFGFEGDADLNVAIRTVTFANGEAVLHSGGGITALSDPAAEYEETELKAERILDAFDDAGEDNP